MLYREISAVCSQIHTKHINTLWAEHRMLKLAVHKVHLRLLKVKNSTSWNLLLHWFIFFRWSVYQLVSGLAAHRLFISQSCKFAQGRCYHEGEGNNLKFRWIKKIWRDKKKAVFVRKPKAGGWQPETWHIQDTLQQWLGTWIPCLFHK